MLKKIDIKIAKIEESLDKDIETYGQLDRGIKALNDVIAQKRGAIAVLKELKAEIVSSKETDKADE